MLKRIISLLLVFTCIGCAGLETKTAVDSRKDILPESNLIATCHMAVEDLLNNCTVSLDRTKPIIVTSLVNINDLEQSSSMGRMAGEMLANELSQKGFRIKELKMGQSKIFIKEKKGEFILSRNLQEIARAYDVQAVLVGTYAVGEAVEMKKYGESMFNKPIKKLYLSIRMIKSDTDDICCSTAASMSITDTSLWK